MSQPQVIATDLDGTLIARNDVLSRRTIEALAAAEAAGITVVMVTARPPRWVDHLVDHVGAHGTALCSNGAFTYDVARREVVEEYVFAEDVATTLVRRLREAVPGVGLASERRDGYVAEHAYAAWDRADRAPLCRVEDITTSFDVLPGKLVATAPDLPGEALHERVAQAVAGLGEPAYSGASGLAEINAVGTSKGVALARWCAARNIPAESVWAFGDMPNDLPMLRWAGRAYAVTNGHADVLAATSYRCDPPEEDGVAAVVEAILAGG